MYENLRLCGPFTVNIPSPEIRSGVVSRQPVNESQERPIRSVLFVTNGAGEVGRADNRADVESGGCAHNTRLQVPKKNPSFFLLASSISKERDLSAISQPARRLTL